MGVDIDGPRWEQNPHSSRRRDNTTLGGGKQSHMRGLAVQGNGCNRMQTPYQRKLGCRQSRSNAKERTTRVKSGW